MTTEEKVSNTARERLGAMDHAMGRLTLQFFSHLHSLLVNNSLHTLADDSILEWNATRQLQFTALVLSLLFTSPSHKVVQPLHVERIAVERPKAIELNGEGTAVRPPAIYVDVVLSLGDHRPLV